MYKILLYTSDSKVKSLSGLEQPCQWSFNTIVKCISSSELWDLFAGQSMREVEKGWKPEEGGREGEGRGGRGRGRGRGRGGGGGGGGGGGEGQNDIILVAAAAECSHP